MRTSWYRTSEHMTSFKFVATLEDGRTVEKELNEIELKLLAAGILSFTELLEIIREKLEEARG